MHACCLFCDGDRTVTTFSLPFVGSLYFLWASEAGGVRFGIWGWCLDEGNVCSDVWG